MRQKNNTSIAYTPTVHETWDMGWTPFRRHGPRATVDHQTSEHVNIGFPSKGEGVRSDLAAAIFATYRTPPGSPQGSRQPFSHSEAARLLDQGFSSYTLQAPPCTKSLPRTQLTSGLMSFAFFSVRVCVCLSSQSEDSKLLSSASRHYSTATSRWLLLSIIGDVPSFRAFPPLPTETFRSTTLDRPNLC